MDGGLNFIDTIRSLIRFREAPHPMVIPELIAVTATINGVAPVEYVRSGKMIAQCQLEARHKIGHHALFAAADLCVEAEALGCAVSFPEDNYPYVKKVVVRKFSDLAKLEIPDPYTHGRMPEILKAVRQLLAGGHNVPVLAMITGPVTIASRIMDIEKMLYMIVDEPEKFKELLGFCRSVSIAFAKAAVREGAHGVLMLDPSSSPSVLPKRIFTDFVLDSVKDVFAGVKEENPDAITWYSVAGPVQTNISILTSVGADISTVDYMVPIETAVRHSYATVINGNIKPNLFYEGTENEIMEKASRLFSATRHMERFILGSGCEVPLNSKLENIQALVKAAQREAEYFDAINGSENGPNEITIMPYRKKVYVRKGSNLLGAVHKAEIPITTYCNKSGSCGKCAVIIKKGKTALPEKIEALQLHNRGNIPNERLACCIKAHDSMEIYIPYSSRVFPTHTALSEEVAENAIKKELDPYGFNSGAFSAQSDKRSSSDTIYGIAVDIGTTTISAYLHDLRDGKLKCMGYVENPQTQWGLDIITRAAKTVENPSLLPKMQANLLGGINNLIYHFRMNHSVPNDQIYNMVVVGNPIIIHLFLGLSPESLSKSPFDTEVEGYLSATAKTIKSPIKLSVNEECRIEILPSIKGFVGSDTVAGILASGMHRAEETSLFVDIGTNAEVVIGNKKRILCTSVAAGPAFEGAHLSHGTLCKNGAILKIRIGPDGKARYETLGNGAPLGICGSGFVDALADFTRLEIINRRGRFNNRGRWTQIKGNVFIVAPKQETAMFNPISISENDIEEIQKAKSAIRTGIELLIREFGADYEDIKNVYLSGSFGTYIDIDNAKTIGMIPDMPNAGIAFIKNSAGLGARMALLSQNARKEAEKIAASAEHVNLANHESFNNLFIDNMLFDLAAK